MTLPLRPDKGGFLRPFGCGWFIIEFLKGNGPEGSRSIDPNIGACMVDIHNAYKEALFRSYAEDAVARDEEARRKKKLPPFTVEEAQERLELYLSRIPYKLTRMRYSSFTRYFGHLKRLGWVKETGETEPSGLQDYYPPAPSRVYYRLTDAGRKAAPEEISNPVRALYPHLNGDYYRDKGNNRRYYSKKKK